MTKFVEVTQENTEELGFDWIVTPFSVSNDRSTFLGGGTNYGTGLVPDDFTQSPGGVSGWPVNNNSTNTDGNGLINGRRQPHGRLRHCQELRGQPAEQHQPH